MKICRPRAVSRKQFVAIKWGCGAKCHAWPSACRSNQSHAWCNHPSSRGLTPKKWKQTATLCPLDWPSNYSLLRLWHVPKDLYQFVDQLNQQLNHRHMFSRWDINYDKFTSRVLYQLPAHYLPEATLRQYVRTTEEARTYEAWFQLTFRPQKWNLKAHMCYQLSPFPSSNATIAMQHHPGNIHQSVATPRYSATPWYVLIQLPNVIDTISKRWRSRKAFNTSPFHIFP